MSMDERPPGGDEREERRGDDHSADGEGPLEEPSRDRAQERRVFKTDGELPEGNRAIETMAVDPVHLFAQAMEQTRMAVTMTDPNAPDNPIVFVNKAFEVLTGYDRKEAVGRNCRFLQTGRTSRHELDRLRRALANEDTVVVELENQRKDGSAFMNALHIGPIYDRDGRLALFYGSLWNVSELVTKREALSRSTVLTRELEHRIGNLFTVISSIVRLSGRGETDVAAVVDKANERILALSRAHSVTSASQGPDGEPASLHDLIDTIIAPYRLNAEGRFVVGGKPVNLPPRAVSPLGLALHELATNSSKYGALKHSSGRVQLEWSLGEELEVVWDEDLDGAAPPERGQDGTGMRILEGILSSIDARIGFEWREQGLRATLCVPLDDAPAYA